MDTADGSLLYPGGVGDVGDRPHDRIVGGGGGGGLGGVGGFGGGNGLRRPTVGVGAGDLGFLPRRIAASSLSDPDSKENLRFF